MTNIIATVGFNIDTSDIKNLEKDLARLDRELSTVQKSAKDSFNRQTVRSFNDASKAVDKVGDSAKSSSKDIGGFRNALDSIDRISGGFLGGVLSRIDEVSEGFRALKQNSDGIFDSRTAGAAGTGGFGAEATQVALLAKANKDLADSNKNVASTNTQVAATSAQATGAFAASGVAALSSVGALTSFRASSEASANTIKQLKNDITALTDAQDILTSRIAKRNAIIAAGATDAFVPDDGSAGMLEALNRLDEKKFTRINGELAATNTRLAAASGSAAGFTGAIGGSTAALLTIGAVIATVVGALAGLKIAFDNLNQIQAINDVADMTGIATEQLSAFAAVAKREDITIEEFGNSLNKMAKAITDAVESNKDLANTFTKLGLSTRELQTLSPEEQFIRIFDAIKKVNDAGTRYDATVAIFGKSGVQLLKAAESGEDLRRVLDEVRTTGEAASEKLVNAANEQDKKIKELNSSWTILKNRITESFAPYLIGGLNLITKALDAQSIAAAELASNLNLARGAYSLLSYLNPFGKPEQPAVPTPVPYVPQANGPTSRPNNGKIIDNTTEAEKRAEAERKRQEAERKAEEARRKAAAEQDKRNREQERKDAEKRIELEKQFNSILDKTIKTYEIRQEFENELNILKEAQAQIASGVVSTQEEYNTFLSQEREIQSIILQIKKDGLAITEDEIRARVAAIRKTQESNDKAIEAAEEAKKKQEEQQKEFEDFIENTFASVGDLLSDSIIEGLETGRFSFKGFLYDLGKLLLTSGIKELFASLFKLDASTMSFGGGGGGGFFSSIFGAIGGLFGFGGPSATFTGWSGGFGGAPPDFSNYAKNGAVFAGDTAKFFANGGVVSGRTQFNYSGGKAIMGEAGAEAIMPLSVVNGKLGVSAVGTGNQTPNVTQSFKMAETIQINVESSGNQNDDQETARTIDKLLNVKFAQFIQDQSRSGGMLSKKIGQY